MGFTERYVAALKNVRKATAVQVCQKNWKVRKVWKEKG